MSEPPRSPERPSKQEVLLALLERSEARVHLDARRPGVLLPPSLLAEGQVRLDYSYGFSPPIPDFKVDEHGISATLSFNRQPQHTFVPWSAVFLIADYDGNGSVWAEDIPQDLLDRSAPTDHDDGDDHGVLGPPIPSPTPPPAKKARPSHLKLVK